MFIHKKHLESLFQEYPVFNTDMYFESRIADIHIEKGVCYITTSNGIKFRLNDVRNYEDNKFIMIEEFSVGDSIVKQAGSDTIYVMKDNGRFYYIQGP
ncbi:MAG: hypothetical protein GF364_04075 [Candidatus Lokiarchaeota archaeon]|nr:hypothetical protein [Candidatus Lokiarchaeota archaeon]